MRRATPFILAVIAGLVLGPAIVLAEAPATAAINIKNFSFGPMTTTVPVGASVTWHNLDGEPHVVASLDGQFRSAALDQNDSFTFTFTKPGEYAYICSIHPQMKAKIIVQ